MSKINALRIINLNYNHNAIHISDEVFHFNGESTLLSLRNGGGKSVLVQMITAPFVHKRYRDAKDRPFESYFTSGKPTFIMVEWALDQGAGYVLTGMMVRKNQEISEENEEELEIVNFISEYRSQCGHDIYHLPVVEKAGRELKLKGFAASVQLFESYKKDRSRDFFYYNMNQPAQSRQYFDKLREYQINYKEWETIIKKVNLKESGLSDLFSDCRDEKGLVEKWFLDAVESKLNKDKDRMKEFENIVTKYISQYKDNRAKIERRDTIRLFQKEAEEIFREAESYRDASRSVKNCENRIVSFMAKLKELAGEAGEKQKELQESAEEIQENIRGISCEKLSYTIYEKQDEQSVHAKQRELADIERGDLGHELDSLTRKLRIQECAKAGAEAEESRGEYELLKEKLSLFNKEKEELEPERLGLGADLKRYYEAGQTALNEEEKRLEREREEAVSGRLRQEEQSGLYQEEISEAREASGAFKAGIEAYGEAEERYNTAFGEGLHRNILGVYEPAALELKLSGYKKELELLEREQLRRKKKLEETSQAKKSLERDREDLGKKEISVESAKKEQEKDFKRMEAELKERRTILRYLDLDEDALFDRERILSAAAKKMREIDQARQGIQKELFELEKEHRRLTQGKVLELSKDLEEMMAQAGIAPVYGMDWLKKNGNPARKNRELVKRNPFLPYALILNDSDLERLKKSGENVYTSAPVPIIRRADLEERSKETDGAVVALEHVSFYVFFNENLLDEEALGELIRQKESRIEEKNRAISIKKQEYSEYFEKQEKIRNQEVTGEGYKAQKRKIESLEEELCGIRGELDEIWGKAARLEEQLGSLSEEIREAEAVLLRSERRIEELELLSARYEKYLEDRDALEKNQALIESLKADVLRSQSLIESLTQKIQEFDNERVGVKIQLQKNETSCRKFQEFDADSGKGETPCLTAETLKQAEARFDALTSQISGEKKELEEALSKAGTRYERQKKELSDLEAKYLLSAKDYENILYIREEYKRLDEVISQKQRELELRNLRWNEEDKALALISQRLDDLKKALLADFSREAPIPREAITQLDFDARISRMKRMGRDAAEKLENVEKKLRSYEENFTALSAEYGGLTLTEEISFEEDFESMTFQELSRYRGAMVVDFREKTAEKRDRKEALTVTINRIVREDAFREDFYQKPLDSLLQLTYDAEQVILQLHTTLSSYEGLMEKLEVDISLVEKEKDKIVEILEDYVKDVHQNLGKIDKNSTITIRDRQIKMLKIEVPDWEENENLYHVRLADFMDEVTAKGLSILEQNGNLAEYLGGQVTTKSLFNTVVGIGNVEIRLYKIEERREYPITWAEVAKNSGGEGFLSAFVILNSLLYYMRRDDTDLFADKREGKVLVMDNPFAQTNASHLLKPLMDMAKKTDTQLICLTGLGGESIYNRFDNIYVLNLAASNLRSGMQFLKAEHLLGDEEETLLISRVEVMDQAEMDLT